MHEHIIRHLEVRELQHRWPEQGVEVGNVLTDEVILLGRWVCQKRIEVAARAREVVFQRCQIADWCI